jgi:hypothetical protein
MVIGAARADDATIKHACLELYPSYRQYFSWRNCVRTKTEEVEKKAAGEAREERARPCIANDIGRMESIAQAASKAVNLSWSLSDTKAALDPIVGELGAVQPAKSDIKTHILSYSIPTKCDSSFHFLINIFANRDGRILYLKTWAVNAPAGYEAGLHWEFSRDLLREASEQDEKKLEEKARNEVVAWHDYLVENKDKFSEIKVVKDAKAGDYVCLNIPLYFAQQEDKWYPSFDRMADDFVQWLNRNNVLGRTDWKYDDLKRFATKYRISYGCLSAYNLWRANRYQKTLR